MTQRHSEMKQHPSVSLTQMSIDEVGSESRQKVNDNLSCCVDLTEWMFFEEGCSCVNGTMGMQSLKRRPVVSTSSDSFQIKTERQDFVS